MARKKKPEFLKKTKETLAKRVSYICSNPDCRCLTSFAHSNKNKASVIGEAAHIKGQKPGTARYDKTLTIDEIRDIENGIWLCKPCHKKVDDDEVKYTVEILQSWKKEAESKTGDYREIIEETAAKTVEKFSIIQNRSSVSIGSIIDYSSATEYQAQLDNARDLINDRKPSTALVILNDLKKRVWNKADDKVKFRILTNIGASKLSLEDENEACKYFIEAYQCDLDDEKAIANIALAHLLNGNRKEAVNFSKKALIKNPSNQQALSIFIQAATDKQREKYLKDSLKTIKNIPEVFFALGFVELKKNNYETAVKNLRKALKLDEGKSLEIPTILAGVLIEKNIPLLKKLEMEGLKQKENKEVEEAISLLDKAWSKVENTELVKAKVKWLVNRSFAKRILGRAEEAINDAKKSYELAPENLDALKNYAIISWETGECDNAYKLLETQKLSDEFPQAIFLMALIKREQKNFNKAISLLREGLKKKGLSKKDKNDGQALLVETLLMAKRRKEAKTFIEQVLKKNKKDITLLIYKSKISQEEGKTDIAVEEAKKAKTFLNNKSPYGDSLIVADQFYKLKLFKEAQDIYEKVINKTVYSELLYRLIHCYYETNNYTKALVLSKTVIKKCGAVEDILKIQGAIFEEQGNLKEALSAYKAIIKLNSQNNAVKIQIGYTFLRQRDFVKLDKYLDETDFNLENLSLSLSYRLAYLFSIRGKSKKFLDTIYEARRQFHNDKKAHVDYILLFFTRLPDTEPILRKNKVGNETAVYLKYSDGTEEFFVFDDRDDIQISLKEIKTDTKFFHNLKDLKVGDKVNIDTNLTAEIVEIKSKYVHALHESMKLQKSFFNDVPDLQSIHMGEPSEKGKLPKGFDVIEEQITKQYEHGQKIEALYKDRKITIGAFANLIGKSLIEVWGGMVADSRLGINYARGDLQERIIAVSSLKKDVQLVIDPLALLTIHSLEIKDIIVKGYGKIGIVQSTIDLINEQITKLEPTQEKGYLSLAKQGKQFTKQEIKPETLKRNIQYLKDLLEWVDKNCEIVTVQKIEDISKDKKKELEDLFGIASIDTVLACRSDKKLLFSDDERLRSVVKNEFNVDGIWTQALLMHSLGKGQISQEKYDDLVIKLVGLNYYYTSVSGKNLLHALKKADWKFDEPYKSSLKMLEPAFSDTNSAINVTVDFLYEIFAQKVIIGDIDNIIFGLLDNITKERVARDTVDQLQRELCKKFYLLPLALDSIDKTIKTWSKTKIL